MRSRTVLFCLALVVAAPPPPAPAGEVAWEDAMGRTVTIRLPVTRLVSLSPSATEILFAVGAGEALAGVSKHCDYPVAAKLKPKAGGFNSPDLDALAEIAPELVLFTEYAMAKDLEALEQLGVASFILPAARLGDIPAAITRLGQLTGREGAAEALAGNLEKELEALRRDYGAIPVAERPQVYVEVDGPSKLYAVGPGSFMDDVLALAGGRNVFAGRDAAYFPVEAAEVVAADPDVILVDHPFQYKAGVAKRPGWDKIEAVRTGRVYDGTDYDIILFNRPGPRIVVAVREIAALLHPGREP